MQHLNNDMEKLVRRAAKNAPVRPKGMNWDAVNAQLQQPQAQNGKVRNTGFKKYWFVLLFILPSLVCDKYLLSGTGNGASVSSMGKSKSLVEKQASYKPVQYEQNKKSFLIGQNKFQPYKNTKAKNVIIIDKWQVQEALTNYLVDKKIVTHYTDKLQHGDFKNIGNPVSLIKKIAIINKPEMVKNNRAKKQRGAFYTSFVMAPELSTVKFQKVKKAGYSVGIKAGYKINDRWAVETGLLWQHKNYYADGKTFNTEKVSLPQHTKLINATGYCNMFDIPLDVRYQFKNTGTSTWYALAGASTYLMQNEDYNYLCERYGQQYNYSWYNNKKANYLFSVINVGLGYEHQLGRLGKIRIEPYAKLPVKEIGIGKLPITSAGVSFGFTHPL